MTRLDGFLSGAHGGHLHLRRCSCGSRRRARGGALLLRLARTGATGRGRLGLPVWPWLFCGGHSVLLSSRSLFSASPYRSDNSRVGGSLPVVTGDMGTVTHGALPSSRNCALSRCRVPCRRHFFYSIPGITVAARDGWRRRLVSTRRGWRVRTLLCVVA